MEEVHYRWSFHVKASGGFCNKAPDLKIESKMFGEQACCAVLVSAISDDGCCLRSTTILQYAKPLMFLILHNSKLKNKSCDQFAFPPDHWNGM